MLMRFARPMRAQSAGPARLPASDLVAAVALTLAALAAMMPAALAAQGSGVLSQAPPRPAAVAVLVEDGMPDEGLPPSPGPTVPDGLAVYFRSPDVLHAGCPMGDARPGALLAWEEMG